jgi:hypothetical protein
VEVVAAAAEVAGAARERAEVVRAAAREPVVVEAAREVVAALAVAAPRFTG